MDNDTNEKSRIKIFQTLTLLGPALFLEKLVPPKKLSDYVHFNRKNSKNFLLLKILTEVQKVGFVFKRWNEYLNRETEAINENNEAQILDSLIDEQSMWQRKLLESLVLLINFATTNDLVFYHHLLLLQELQHYQREMSEQEHFFHHGNALTKKTVKLLTDRIEMVENEIGDLSKCWYLASKKKASERPWFSIVSFRMQLKTALKVASAREKTALGYTYNLAYGETSGNIHFSPIKLEYADRKKRFSFGIAQCSQLSTKIIKRAHELTGIKPEGVNVLITRTDSDRQTKDNALIKRLEIGDFVIANGPYLGEIVELSQNTFGYESYRIKYLADSPIEGIYEAWFPSVDVQLFMRRSELIEELQKSLKEGIEPSPPFTDSEIQQAIYKSVIELWTRGIGIYMNQVATPMRVGDRGIGYVPEN
jgi:hypothetical protein